MLRHRTQSQKLSLGSSLGKRQQAQQTLPQHQCFSVEPQRPINSGASHDKAINLNFMIIQTTLVIELPPLLSYEISVPVLVEFISKLAQSDTT